MVGFLAPKLLVRDRQTSKAAEPAPRTTKRSPPAPELRLGWGLLSRPAPTWGLSAAAITCVWIHEDLSLFWVTLLPHAGLFPGLSLRWGFRLGHGSLRVWSEVEGKDGLSGS